MEDEFDRLRSARHLSRLGAPFHVLMLLKQVLHAGPCWGPASARPFTGGLAIAGVLSGRVEPGGRLPCRSHGRLGASPEPTSSRRSAPRTAAPATLTRLRRTVGGCDRRAAVDAGEWPSP